jgi:hypothetical protein
MMKRLLNTLILSQAFALRAYAQGNGTGGGCGGDIPNPLSTCSVSEFVLQIIQILITLGTYVLVVAIIYTGFLFITAQGSEAQVSKARNALFYTVIGGAVLLGSWVLATAVANTITSL